jgi:hypothetical protein
MTKLLVAIAFASSLLGQGQPSRPPLTDAQFRAAIHDLAPGEPIPGKPMRDQRIVDFTSAYEDAAIPILVDEIKTRIANRRKEVDPKAEWTIFTFLQWATYSADQRAVDAVGELCAASEKDCKFFVTTLLNSAEAGDRTYGAAHNLVEGYPQLRDLAIAWCEQLLKNGGAEYIFGEEMVDRVEQGNAIKDDDVILSHLAPETRAKIMRAFEQLNRERQPRKN